MTYADMFVSAIQSFGVLCIGLYRLRDATLSPDENPSAKRYVITNPADDSTLLYTDRVCRELENARFIFANFILKASPPVGPIDLSGCEGVSKVLAVI